MNTRLGPRVERRVSRRQFLLASAGALAACAIPKVRSRPDPHSLAGRLRVLAVADDDFYRPILYTWTTIEGIANLRAHHRLLVATATMGGFVSAFIRELVVCARAGGSGAKLAEILVTHPSLIRRRYAWTAPFATVMGLGRRTYGTSLIRIELRPEAWIARFEPAVANSLTVVDAAGAIVSTDAVLAAPERIGAVFHVHSSPSFREYVVCSETMVATWSIATDDILDELASEAALLRDVRDHAALAPSESQPPASGSWQRTPDGDLRALWDATLAFDNHRYRVRARQLDAILGALDAYDAAGEPLVVSPRHAAAYSARSNSHSSSSAT